MEMYDTTICSCASSSSQPSLEKDGSGIVTSKLVLANHTMHSGKMKMKGRGNREPSELRITATTVYGTSEHKIVPYIVKLTIPK